MFDNPLLNITIFGGGLLVLIGIITLVFPPKKINSLYGYRTSSSMKNQESWTFAQLYSSKELIKLGSVLVTCSSLNLIATFSNETNLTIGLSLLILIVILLFIRVESAIKQKFNQNELMVFLVKVGIQHFQLITLFNLLWLKIRLRTHYRL